MDFAAAFRYPFRGPHAWANIGLLFVCFLIPIVGPLVASGYIVVMEKRLIADPLADPPRFDFGRFGDYLQRGLWPLLVSLVLVPVLWIIYAPLGIATMIIIITLQKQVALMVVLLTAVVVLQLLLTMLLTVVMQPIAFKSGLEQTFTGAFDWNFIVSWVRKVGWLTMGAMLLVMLVAAAGAVLLVCTFIGMYAWMGVIMIIQGHLQVQLYRIYLERGGTPLNIAPEPLAAPQPTYGFPTGPAAMSGRPLNSPPAPPPPWPEQAPRG